MCDMFFLQFLVFDLVIIKLNYSNAFLMLVKLIKITFANNLGLAIGEEAVEFYYLNFKSLLNTKENDKKTKIEWF